LQIRDFRLLFAANTISRVGNAFTSVALAFGILDATGSTQDIGIVLAFRLVAQVALLLIGGAWGDRISRRTMLVRTAFLCGLTQAGIAALFLTHSGQLWSLSLLATVNGAALAFSAPAAVGVIPQIVPEDLLQSANALSSIVRNSANIGGAALAGVLVAATNPGWALAIDAASFFISVVLIMRMSPLAATGGTDGLWAELKEGWQEFISRTWVWAIVVQFTLLNMAFVAALNVYAPVIAKIDLGGPAAYGVMTAALGVGGVLGGVLMLRYRPARPLVSATMSIFLSLSFFVLLAVAAPLWAISVAAAASGIGIEVFSVLWASALQHYIPPARLSRVSAYDSLGSIAFTPIGLALAGPLATALGGVHRAMWAAVVVAAVPTALVLLVPDIWRIGRQPTSKASSAELRDEVR
jgi:MFS family permease